MELVNALREIGIEGARYVEEHGDPQFQAIKRFPDPRGALANALVSYQLSMRGEDYWNAYASFFSFHPLSLSNFLLFLKTHNPRLFPAKKRRLERIWGFLERMDPEHYYGDMVALWQDLAGVLGTKKEGKTVVFAVKMFGYAMRILTGKFIPYPMEVPIPLDSRILRLTRSLTSQDPLSFWFQVSQGSGVPPLHIDSLLWPAMGSEQGRKALMELGDPGKRILEILNVNMDF